MRSFPLPITTLFANLEERAHDADFAETFSADDPIESVGAGAFSRKKRNGRFYWYWQWRDGNTVRLRYVGPVTDKAITERVKRFAELKFDYDERRALVRSLVSAGLPRADAMSGEIIDAMGRAGFFRLRGVLIGTAAYQCYAGVLGARIKEATTMTEDADLAQFFAIANQIDDQMLPILDVLRDIDETFNPVPHISGSSKSTCFINRTKFKVEFLTPNRGSDDYEGRPAKMAALSGAAAQPLRFLDFLIRNPMRSVVLHGAGVPVTVPTPERYAIHKLIVAERRKDSNVSKINKDVAQSVMLIEAMSQKRFVDLSSAWQEAWERGASWREQLASGLLRLGPEAVAMLREAVEKGAKRRRKNAAEFWPEL